MTNPTRKTGLMPLRTQDAQLNRFADGVLEHLEVLHGSRGDPLDRAVTLRDLQAMGFDVGALAASRGSLALRAGAGSAVTPLVSAVADKLIAQADMDAFARAITDTALFKELMKPMQWRDPAQYDWVPEQLRRELMSSIVEEAARRGTDISRVETIVKDGAVRFAKKLEEITASIGESAAGVRQLTIAYADGDRAVAGTVTEIGARMGKAEAAVGVEAWAAASPNTSIATITSETKARLEPGGDFAAVKTESKTTADKVTGLSAQYTVKVQAGGAIAGFGIAANSDGTPGGTSSAFIVAADKFAIVSPSYSGGLTNVPNLAHIPFGVDASGVYIKGQVRINAGGAPINELIVTAKVLSLSASSQIMKFNAEGTAPDGTQTITFTAALQNLTGTANFIATPYNAAGTALANIFLGGSGNTRTLSSTQWPIGAVRVVVTASLNGVSDVMSVIKLKHGESALNGFLTNEAMTFAADKAGVVSSFTGGTGNFKVYFGTEDKTPSSTFAVTSQTGCAVSITASGAYTVTAMSANTATATLTATYSGQTITKILSLSKSLTGVDGKTGAAGNAGVPGVRGPTRTVSTVPGLSAWNSSYAESAISSLGFTKVLRDEVTLRNSDTAPTYIETRYWDGSAWAVPGVTINGNLLVGGSITAEKIAADAIFGNALNVQSPGPWSDMNFYFNILGVNKALKSPAHFTVPQAINGMAYSAVAGKATGNGSYMIGITGNAEAIVPGAYAVGIVGSGVATGPNATGIGGYFDGTTAAIQLGGSGVISWGTINMAKPPGGTTKFLRADGQWDAVTLTKTNISTADGALLRIVADPGGTGASVVGYIGMQRADGIGGTVRIACYS